MTKDTNHDKKLRHDTKKCGKRIRYQGRDRNDSVPGDTQKYLLQNKMTKVQVVQEKRRFSIPNIIPKTLGRHGKRHEIMSWEDFVQLLVCNPFFFVVFSFCHVRWIRRDIHHELLSLASRQRGHHHTQ